MTKSKQEHSESKQEHSENKQEHSENKYSLISKNKYFDVDHWVFWPSSVLIIFFIVITLIIGAPMGNVFEYIQEAISEAGGWFFVLAVNFFLIFVLVVALSKFGNIRLGGRNAKPEFRISAWFSMLFSAGMGIGILFWSVGEPVLHYVSPPFGTGETAESASFAMQTTFLHWGLHAWGIYALVGMSLAFFTFNKKLPLTISSVFYPLIGDRINSGLGKAINVMAVVATLFGLATSLGLGVQQISAGLNHLFDLPDNVRTQVILIIIITLIATGSVVAGLSHGVKRLSQLNVIIGAILLIFVLIAGPSLFIFGSFVQNIGGYLDNFFALSFWTETYEQTHWQKDWTVFYWAWWISWSPFVGMFIARISRGRSLREFVLGVLIVPSLITFLWVSAFGGSALFVELKGLADISTAVQDNVAISLFQLFDQLPLASVASVVAVVLVTNFFVTSSDSGSLVIDSLTAGGKLDAPVAQRIFWATTEGAVAAVLLIGGGLSALQTASIITGLPFTLILIIMAFSLWKALREEHNKISRYQKEKERKSYQEVIKDLIIKREKEKTKK